MRESKLINPEMLLILVGIYIATNSYPPKEQAVVRLNEYDTDIRFLEQKGFIELEYDKKFYLLTTKGKRLIKMCEEFMDFAFLSEKA